MLLKMILVALMAGLATVFRCQAEMAARVETFTGPERGDLSW